MYVHMYHSFQPEVKEKIIKNAKMAASSKMNDNKIGENETNVKAFIISRCETHLLLSIIYMRTMFPVANFFSL